MARELRQIGQGGFGSVWLHQDEQGLYFARKMFHAGCREYARKEYQMLAQLNHANIIKLAVSCTIFLKNLLTFFFLSLA